MLQDSIFNLQFIPPRFALSDYETKQAYNDSTWGMSAAGATAYGSALNTRTKKRKCLCLVLLIPLMRPKQG